MSRAFAAVLLALGVAVGASLVAVTPAASVGSALASASSDPTDPAGPGPSRSSDVGAADEGAADQGAADQGAETGRILYLADCASCHGQELEGSQRGPTLIGVGEASVDFQLRTGRMPLEEERASPSRSEPHYGPEEIDALVRYVGAFGGPPVPTVGPGDLALGRQLYLLNCAACHSATGSGYTQVGGRVAPSLLVAAPVEVAEAVRVGPGLMPRFPEDTIDQAELDAVVTYVQELQQAEGPGGAVVGRFGPVVETLVGFAALALLVVLIRGLGKRVS